MVRLHKCSKLSKGNEILPIPKNREEIFGYYAVSVTEKTYLRAACAAASLAIGTRNGEQDT